jgi:hypothetical protein
MLHKGQSEPTSTNNAPSLEACLRVSVVELMLGFTLIIYPVKYRPSR